MEVQIDHYVILGLPSGEEGAKLTDKDIARAYKWKALELHPDKRRGDPNAREDFQTLRSSYEVLKDGTARKLFDDLLRARREQMIRRSHHDAKRRKMVSDLEAKERAASSPDVSSEARAKEEEARITRRLHEEIERIRESSKKKKKKNEKEKSGSTDNTPEAQPLLDREKVLKVSWVGAAGSYSCQSLREAFGAFGEVEDIVIRGSSSASTKKKMTSSALIVMRSREVAARVAAEVRECGDPLNPLIIRPLDRVTDEPDRLRDLAGAGHQAFEDSVLKKLRMHGATNRHDAFPGSSG